MKALNAKLLQLYLCFAAVCAANLATFAQTRQVILKPDGQIDFAKLQIRLLDIIASTNTTGHDLSRAIEHLARPSEPAAFWTSIVNDPRFSEEHRRKCLFAFFRRHGTYSTCASSLAAMLNKPTWLRDADVSVVATVIGIIPVESNERDTIFKVNALSDKFCIYVRVLGKETTSTMLYNMLNGNPSGKSGVRDAIIMEIGLFDEIVDEQIRGAWRKVQKIEK